MLILQNRQTLTTLRTLVIASRNYCKDYASSSDDEQKPKKKQKKEKPVKETVDAAESAATRLNRLLATMTTLDNNSTLAQQVASAMPRPGEAHRKLNEATKQKATEKDIVVAAKRVASLLGEEHKAQTESELLSKLLGRDQDSNEAAAEAVEGVKQAPKGNELSLSDLIVGMKIDRTQQPREQSRAEFVRRTLAAGHRQQKYESGANLYQRNNKQSHKREAESFTGSVNLFGGTGLGIFKDCATQLRDVPDTLSTWDQLYQRELKLLVTHPPSNYFEKVALWTEQGKVWRFPIDNEQDMHEEAATDFSEHVFLEQHLEPWCPNKGPIRHFMELVCVGLSKNPYISAKDKREHILWYRDYFESKRDLLKDLMSKEKMEQIGKEC